MVEQRQHPRVTINHEFESIEEFIAEYVTNISHGGVFIRSKTPLPIGTKVNLRFSVIIDDIETIEGEGEVVRVVDTPEDAGMGVAFTRLTANSKALVDQLLAQRDLSE